MITVRLGVEGEYGVRLVRYLENHMDRSIRLRHFTRPDQWDMEVAADDIIVMNHRFFSELSEADPELFEDRDILWISDREEKGAYCRYHPPEKLIDLIMGSLREGADPNIRSGSRHEVCAVFSPVPDERTFILLRSYMKEGDLYLGMEDIRSEDSDLIQDPGGHTGDLCYYIHLRDTELVSRIKELAVRYDGCDFLPSAPVLLPLLELGDGDYRFLFDQIRSSSVYSSIFVSIGFGMLSGKGMLSHINRLILLSSRQNMVRQTGCESLLQYLKAGYGQFSGSCDIVYRENLDLLN